MMMMMMLMAMMMTIMMKMMTMMMVSAFKFDESLHVAMNLGRRGSEWVGPGLLMN